MLSNTIMNSQRFFNLLIEFPFGIAKRGNLDREISENSANLGRVWSRTGRRGQGKLLKKAGERGHRYSSRKRRWQYYERTRTCRNRRSNLMCTRTWCSKERGTQIPPNPLWHRMRPYPSRLGSLEGRAQAAARFRASSSALRTKPAYRS